MEGVIYRSLDLRRPATLDDLTTKPPGLLQPARQDFHVPVARLKNENFDSRPV